MMVDTVSHNSQSTHKRARAHIIIRRGHKYFRTLMRAILFRTQILATPSSPPDKYPVCNPGNGPCVPPLDLRLQATVGLDEREVGGAWVKGGAVPLTVNTCRVC